MNYRVLGLVAMFLVIASALTGVVSADVVPVTIDSIKVDGDSIDPWSLNRLSIERGDEIEVKVSITAVADAQNIEIEAEITGYEYSDREETSDSSNVFDVEANVTYTKRLKVPLPNKIEEDSYKLRITVSHRYNDAIIQNYNLKIDAPRHSMDIKDIVLTPENEVKAGRALLATVRVKNLGDKDEESVKVTVSIPSLGLSASDYIDEVEEDDSETSEELYLRIPVCAEEGSYDVVATVEYDEGYEDVSETTSIEVINDGACEASNGASSGAGSVPDVVAGSTLENMVAGQGGAIYPITITNNAGAKKTFSVTVDGVNDWGTVKISPTNTAVIDAGDTISIYVFVAAKDGAAPGQQIFTATVKSGSETIKQLTMTANIAEGGSNNDSSWGGAKKGLEIALVVLVALLVILGLVIGFNKLKNDEGEAGAEEAETYY